MKINTFLIGVQKAGTSTFWSWLTQHPDVYGPELMKDFHFFTRPTWRDKGHEYLHSFYKDYEGENIVLHGGVNYYFDPEFLDHVLEYHPNARYIIILRDPVERAWSAFQYFSKLGQEKRSFVQAIEDELQSRNSPDDRHMYAYLEHGLYAKYLRKILQRIRAKQLLVLDYQELFGNPDEKMRETFSFLGIEPEVQVNFSVKKKQNRSGQISMAQ